MGASISYGHRVHPAEVRVPTIQEVSGTPGSPNDYYHFGFTAKSPTTGKWVHICRLGTSHTGNDGKVIILRSNDGLSWVEDAIAVYDGIYDDRGGTGGYSNNGRLHLLFPVYNPPSTWMYLLYMYSDDDGVTWSSPVTIQTYATGDAIYPYGKLIELPNGDLMLGAHGWIPDGTISIGYLLSGNGGLTWIYNEILNTGTTSIYGEPSITQISPTELVCMARVSLVPYNITFRQFYSGDLGVTWVDQGYTIFDIWDVPPVGRERQTFITTITYLGETVVAFYWVNTIDQKFKVIYAKPGDFATRGIHSWNRNTMRLLIQLENYPGFDFTRDGHQTVVHEPNQWVGIGSIFVEYTDTANSSSLRFFSTPADNQTQVWYELGLATAPAYEAETLALLARFSTEPSVTIKDLINKTVVDLKAAGIWSKGIVLNLFGMHSAQACVLNIFSSNYDSALNGSAFEEGFGVNTQGVGKLITNSFDLNNLSLANYTVSFMSYNLPTSSNYSLASDVSGFHLYDYRTSARWYAFNTGYYNNMDNSIIQPNTIYTVKSNLIQYAYTYNEGNSLDARWAYTQIKSAGMTMRIAIGVASGGGSQYYFVGEYLTDQELTDLARIIHYFYDTYQGAATGFAVTWIDDFARMSVATIPEDTQIEWSESEDGKTYTVLATTAIGVSTYDNYTWQNKKMYFRSRSLKSGVYSQYSAVVILQTPLVWKTDQTTPTTLRINSAIVVAGKTVTINYGNGDSFVMIGGTTTNLDYNYLVLGIYFVSLTGDINELTTFQHINQVKSFGDLTKWVIPTKFGTINYRNFKIDGNNFSGNILCRPNIFDGYTATTGIQFSIYNNSFSGELPTNMNVSGGITELYIHGTNQFSGDLSTMIIAEGASTKWYVFLGNNFTDLPRGNFRRLTTFQFADNNVTTAKLDAWLVYLNSSFTTYGAPFQNCTYTLNGTGMGAPTGGALNADIVAIKDIYTAVGKVATFVINT